MKLGTLLVLVGAVLFALALILHLHGEPSGRFFASNFILALAGLLTASGVLLGADALHVSHS